MKILRGVCMAFFLATNASQAFSLLGPHEDWMQLTNGFRYAGDIGGPMQIDAEYRWNVPVVTYAFDQSFLDYFGSNGVVAVEQAIAILNGLPPASQLDPSDYPPETLQYNFQAQAVNLSDLKSTTLSLLLEQLGLTAPTWSLFCIQSFTMNGNSIQPTIIQRNFDPITFGESNTINDSDYSYNLDTYTNGSQMGVIARPFVLDPFDPYGSAVADGMLAPGAYYAGLTRDDVGGLRYLLNKNNVNPEITLSGVRGAGTNAGTYVAQALRRGVDKITFMRVNHDEISGQLPQPITNQFVDCYITNNVSTEQLLERVITVPDFVFSAGSSSGGIFDRTGTSNWWNSASGSDAGGPGIIRPPIKISFSKARRTIATSDDSPEGYFGISYLRWGSFDESTNGPVVYPSGSQSVSGLTIQLQLSQGINTLKTFEWQVPASAQTVEFQTSTNLTHWTSLVALANEGAVVQWLHWCSGAKRFFRIVPH